MIYRVWCKKDPIRFRAPGAVTTAARRSTGLGCHLWRRLSSTSRSTMPVGRKRETKVCSLRAVGLVFPRVDFHDFAPNVIDINTLQEISAAASFLLVRAAEERVAREATRVHLSEAKCHEETARLPVESDLGCRCPPGTCRRRDPSSRARRHQPNRREQSPRGCPGVSGSTPPCCGSGAA